MKKQVRDNHFLTMTYMGVETNILLSNIVYLESQLRKVNFYLQGGKMLTLTAKLDNFLSLMTEPHFCRCHKSFIVNLNYVATISGEYFFLINDGKIKISRSYLAEAKKAYFSYVFGKGGAYNGL